MPKTFLKLYLRIAITFLALLFLVIQTELVSEESLLQDDIQLNKGVLYLLKQDLMVHPDSKKHSVLNQLQQQFYYSIALVKTEELPSEELYAFKGHWIDPDTDYIYSAIENSEYSIKISPFEETDVDYRIMQVLLISFFLLLALSLLFWLWPIQKQLKYLIAGSKEIAQGNFSTRIPEKAKPTDEIQQLMTTFNYMASRIESATEQRRELIAALSHEIKTPLARIRFAAELLKDDDPELEEIDSIVEDVDDIDELIQNLLHYIHIKDLEASKLQPISTRLWFEKYFSAYKLANSTQRYRFDASVRNELITIDSDQFYIAISNLLNNASQYANSQVSLTLEERDHQLLIHIDDDGNGIPEDVRQHIFEPLYRTDSSRSRQSGGTGLGLAIVDRIVQHHNGSIAVSSSPSLSGARFSITLPITDGSGH